MRLAWMNCATTCTVNDADFFPTNGDVGQTFGGDKNVRVLCQNVGGSGGYFVCDWRT